MTMKMRMKKKTRSKKTNSREIFKMKRKEYNGSEYVEDGDFDEDQESIFDIKKQLTKKLITKQKYSDKLYPGGERCDSMIIESKSVISVSDNSVSDLNLNDKEEQSNTSVKENNLLPKKNKSFSGPVPPFRKDRSNNLSGSKTPKSPSSGNNSLNMLNVPSSQEEKNNLLTSRRISSKPKKRPPSHIGISKNSIKTNFTLKEDDDNSLFSTSNQESYVKYSGVKVAKKVNLLRLPSKELIKLDVDDKEKDKPEKDKSESKAIKMPSDNDNKKEEYSSTPEAKNLHIKSYSSVNPVQNEEGEEEDKLKANNRVSFINKRASMLSPNFLSELGGQLNKRASLNVSINVEERMQANKKQMEKENSNNKNMFDVKLRSKTHSTQNSSQDNSSNNSELSNNPFFMKRATLINSSESDNIIKEESPSFTKLKNDDHKTDDSIESPSLCKPSNFNKKAKNNNTLDNNDGSNDTNKNNDKEDRSYERLSVMDKISLLQKK